MSNFGVRKRHEILKNLSSQTVCKMPFPSLHTHFPTLQTKNGGGEGVAPHLVAAETAELDPHLEILFGPQDERPDLQNNEPHVNVVPAVATLAADVQ